MGFRLQGATVERAKTLKSLVIVTSLLVWASVLLAGCQKEQPAVTAKPVQTNAQAATATPEQPTAQVAEQTTCPVMGGPIDKNIFIEYQGKKVYFCCKACPDVFKADPAKYIAKLPQFAQ